MKVSGFTIVRNAVKFDYPVVESISSVLPLVDEMIVLIGNSDDETVKLIENIGSNKIKIHHSKWDENLRKNGTVLAVETDKAFKLISPESDWAVYVQADEVLHENDYETIQNAMKANVRFNEVDGFLFGYKHFFGSYDFIAASRSFYRHEIRVIRNNPNIHSYRDAQGFRKKNKKLKVKKIDASVYHYGWVRHPKIMSDKIKEFHKLWHNDEWINAQTQLNESFDYNNIDAVIKFSATHPAVMKNRIEQKNWDFTPKLDESKINGFNKFLYFIERNTGYRIAEYKNFELI
ncbi:MAG: glycosyltransferase family 2 protein [Bacteroidia bacterium]